MRKWDQYEWDVLRNYIHSIYVVFYKKKKKKSFGRSLIKYITCNMHYLHIYLPLC